MSIKSDRWIRRMARETGMIEPFTDGQVRAGAISYGVSSYGYDMRVAPEFKIFTNVLSAIVDPKNFDDKSFVEFAGDVCVVPPNSFALARSVEYFRIPRNVLPAKIYANEGICQVLFFEADDDDVCETSYADKKGKYQAQRGVTLPRL